MTRDEERDQFERDRFDDESGQDEPDKQTTDEGLEISVPRRRDFFGNLKKLAKRPPVSRRRRVT